MPHLGYFLFYTSEMEPNSNPTPITQSEALAPETPTNQTTSAPIPQVSSSIQTPVTTNQPFPWAITVLSVLVVIASAAAMYFYISGKRENIASVQQVATSTQETVDRVMQDTPASQQENILHGISVKDLHTGDIFDNLKVTAVKYLMEPVNDDRKEYLSSASVSFSGPIIVSGKVWWSEMFDQVCMAVDPVDVYKIPHFKEDTRSPGAMFCFSDPVNTLPLSLRDTTKTNPQQGFPVKVEIDKYQVLYSEKESSDIAKFIRIVQ